MTSYIPSITLPSFVFEKPAVAILVPVLLGTGVGFSMQPRDTQQDYLALKQPPLRPPPAVFGPTWTLLYGCMGYASYRAWTTGMSSLQPGVHEWTEQAASLYTIQLGLNLIWMPLFFKYRKPVAATVDIVAITGIAGYAAWMFGQVDEVAGYFMAPYVAWLGFATYLCVGAGYLNGWNFDDKVQAVPPTMKNTDTTYVDEAQ